MINITGMNFTQRAKLKIISMTIKVTQNSFLFFETYRKFFGAWNSTVLNGCAIFFKATLHCTIYMYCA